MIFPLCNAGWKPKGDASCARITTSYALLLINRSVVSTEKGDYHQIMDWYHDIQYVRVLDRILVLLDQYHRVKEEYVLCELLELEE
ncbi:MAG: hypothetical protein EZS28_001038 [Streblomastix strix]|uniref:Uncharacterized protein n=1 Tax=Streblomastix strix TaxID=222440 RepID=A0A5J4X9F7_9EUKA|nr:MAG: hypothetical protein EZS28_001038 [Streblomastix strix]